MKDYHHLSQFKFIQSDLNSRTEWLLLRESGLASAMSRNSLNRSTIVIIMILIVVIIDTNYALNFHYFN